MSKSCPDENYGYNTISIQHRPVQSSHAFHGHFTYQQVVIRADTKIAAVVYIILDPVRAKAAKTNDELIIMKHEYTMHKLSIKNVFYMLSRFFIMNIFMTKLITLAF